MERVILDMILIHLLPVPVKRVPVPGSFFGGTNIGLALYGVGRKKVKIADAKTTIARTGYAPEGVPPVGHRTPLPVLIDDTPARFEIVYAAAGSENAIFGVPYETLVEMTGGRVADVAKG